MRGTKLLVTIGPASRPTPILRALVAAGADGVRINFSHGSDAEHREIIQRVRRLGAWRSDRLAVVADLQGPKIRIGALRGDRCVLVEGSTVRLDRSAVPGDAERIPVPLRELPKVVQTGDPLLLGDGSVSLEVVRVDGEEVRTRVTQGGPVSSHAGLFLPRAHLRPTILGPKDLHDLTIALDEGVDFVAVSFVRDGRDLRSVRRVIAARAGAVRPGLIAKIERAEALDHLDEILAEADGVMVARGDLGIEVPLEQLAGIQKEILRRARAAGRFAIVATQMLLSMVTAPRPTRAEATDVANAVLDGADCLMLSEESAVGSFPVEATRWLSRIGTAAEPLLARMPVVLTAPDPPTEEVVARSAVRLAEETHAGAIVVPTHSGRTAGLVALHRPLAPIWAVSASASVRRSLALTYGVRAFPAPPHQTLVQLRQRALALARREEAMGGPLVLTAGYPVEGRPTNLVTLVERPVGPRAGAGRHPKGSARRGARAATKRA